MNDACEQIRVRLEEEEIERILSDKGLTAHVEQCDGCTALFENCEAIFTRYFTVVPGYVRCFLCSHNRLLSFRYLFCLQTR